jgi:hypothetical protein
MRIPIAVLALSFLLGAETARGADPILEVIPAEVVTRTLPKDAPLDLEVWLQAPDRELTDIVATTFSNDGIRAEFAPETPCRLPKLAPSSEYAWRLKLTRTTGSVLTESILHVKVGFDVAPAAGSPPVAPSAGTPPAAPGAGPPAAAAGAGPAPTHRLLYRTAKIKPQAVVTGIELAKVEIKSAPETLHHERKGSLFLLVTNQYSRPITITDVQTLVPDSIKPIDLNSGHPKLPVTVHPGQAVDLGYPMEAKGAVVPGKYSFIATVDVKSDEDNLKATVRTSPQEINIAVLGESDVLKFLGIPSLLFLPGVLMLTAWRFLWSLDKGDDAVAKYRLPFNGSDFWIIAIALSLGTALIYPWLTGWVPPYERRDFVAAYGFLDFGLILGFSLVASALVFGAWRGLGSARRVIRESKIAETTPSTEDTPLQILEKLAKFQKDTLFEQYYVEGRDPAERLLALEPWSNETELWLVPPAKLKDVNQHNYQALDESDNLFTAPLAGAASVLAKLRQGVLRNWWGDPEWRRVGDVQHPIKVPKTGWKKFPSRGRLIQDE